MRGHGEGVLAGNEAVVLTEKTKGDGWLGGEAGWREKCWAGSILVLES